MAISVGCAVCGRLVRAKDELAGKRMKCPHCGARLVLPIGDDAPAPANELQPEKRIAPLAYAAFFLAAATMICWPLGPITLAVGILAFRDIDKDPNKVGKGRAIYGIVWGAIACTLMAFFLLVKLTQ
jgi:hypothetical protein